MFACLQTGCSHVSLAYGLDFLNPANRTIMIELPEEIVEEADNVFLLFHDDLVKLANIAEDNCDVSLILVNVVFVGSN